MFIHNFCYRLKCLLRNRSSVFWTLTFPLILATLFYFAFGHLTSDSEAFQTIKTAVIADEAYAEDLQFRQVLATLSQPGENQFLELTLTDEQEGEKLLEAGNVAGIITVNQEFKLTVGQKGLQETILKTFLDEYTQTRKTVTEILKKNPQAASRLLDNLENRDTYTEQIWFSRAKPDTVLGFFYALIAMTCMYGSIWGLENTIDLQADLSPQGARRSTAPIHKLTIVASDSLAALVISFGEVLILLAYLDFVLKISFGEELGLILLLCCTGCAAGVALGNYLGTIAGVSENTKSGIVIAVNMICSFFAGLMWAEIKEIIARQAPLFAYLNPASLVADSFYSLYIFDTYNRFFVNIACLCFIAIFLSLASFSRLRRETYASI